MLSAGYGVIAKDILQAKSFLFEYTGKKYHQ